MVKTTISSSTSPIRNLGDLNKEPSDLLAAARRNALTRGPRPGFRAAALALARILRARGACVDCGADDHTIHPAEGGQT